MKTFLKFPNEDIFKLANEDRVFFVACACVFGGRGGEERGWLVVCILWRHN